MRWPWSAVFLATLLPAWGRSQAPTVDVEPPIANRKEPFSGAVGRKFSVTTRAEPTKLQVGDTLRFTVQVVAEGAWQRPPQRPDLRRHPEYAHFAEQFHIENGGERLDEKKGTWEFVYLLRPLNDTVTAVPRLAFVYYRPNGGYQTPFSAPAIKLKVLPRAEVSPSQVQGAGDPLPLPDRLYAFRGGEAVLRHEDSSVVPSGIALAAFLIGIPMLCTWWFVAWRRRYPEAARRAQLRRSRAARTALDALRRVVRSSSEECIRQSSLILATYLRQRFDLLSAEPTPVEIATHLHTAGIAPELTEAVAAIFLECDAVRFAAAPPGDLEQWIKRISEVILDLEAAPCSSPAS